MPRYLKNLNRTLNKIPGEIIFVGEQLIEKPEISVLDYSDTHCKEFPIDLDKLDDLDPLMFDDHPTWINICGLHDTEFIKRLGAKFDLHPLILEDLVNTEHRPKMDISENAIFIITKMFHLNKIERVVETEQLSLILCPYGLITFQEHKVDIFDGVRNRLRNARGRTRFAGLDYLLYCLLDALVDNYLEVISDMGYEVEQVETKVISGNDPNVLQLINDYKIELNFFHRNIYPIKEIILRISTGDHYLIKKKSKQFYSDLSDLTSMATDSLESYRTLLNDQLHIFHTIATSKLNDVMKILTAVTTIFIPMSFLAGVYGMNFEYMPELGKKWAYPLFWLFTLSIGFFLLYFFKKKKWL